VYFYVNFGDTSGDPGALVGSYWETGNPVNDNETYPVGEWILDNAYYPNSDSWYINGNLGDARTDCVFNSMTLEASNLNSGGWFIATVSETPGGFHAFDFTSLGTNFDGTVAVRPAVNGSGRAGDLVNLNVSINPGTSYGAGDATIDETQIYQFGPTATAPATRNPADWTLLGSIVGNGGTTDVSVDCTGFAPGDQAFVGTAFVAGGNTSQIAGELTVVECDPNLADPGTQFKLIDRDNIKKGKGAKRNR
jgi:hypothetical protein